MDGHPGLLPGAGRTGGGLRERQRRRADLPRRHGTAGAPLAKATDQGALDAELTEADKAQLLEFLQDFGGIGDKTADFTYAGGARGGFAAYPGAGNDEGTPLPGPPSLSEVLASAVGRHLTFELGYDQAMLMFQPVGGMDRIPQALRRAVGPGRVRLGAEVTAVTDRPWGVEVSYRQQGRTRTLEADYCVATLPPHLLARIPHNLGTLVQTALQSFPPIPAGKIGLEYRSRWQHGAFVSARAAVTALRQRVTAT